MCVDGLYVGAGEVVDADGSVRIVVSGDIGSALGRTSGVGESLGNTVQDGKIVVLCEDIVVLLALTFVEAGSSPVTCSTAGVGVGEVSSFPSPAISLRLITASPMPTQLHPSAPLCSSR